MAQAKKCPVLPLTRRRLPRTMMKLNDGYTLMHEHMTIDLSPGDLSDTSFDEMCCELRLLRQHGIANIVDLTNQSMGRNPEYVSRLMEHTGMNIIMSTGYYLDAFMESLTVEKMADTAIRDLTVGIDHSGIKAGVIGEIGWTYSQCTALEARAWEAMSIAALKTGAVVMTHPSTGRQELKQAQWLISKGISPKKIVIGHIEFFPTWQDLLQLLDMEVTIGMDMIGKVSKERDVFRANVIAALKYMGYLDQVVLSMDICRKEVLLANGGYGYKYLFDEFIPMLKKRGVTEDDIDCMLRENPKRILGVSGDGSDNI